MAAGVVGSRLWWVESRELHVPEVGVRNYGRAEYLIIFAEE